MRYSHHLKAVMTGAALALTAGRAMAFNTKGHMAVEHGAYEILRRPNAPRDVVRTLIAAGVMRPPVSLDRDGSYYGAPILSHLPDHSMDRQLQSYGQCFHFMARGADVTQSDDTIDGIPDRLVVDAYLRCMSVVDTLFRGILFDPQDSAARHADVYILMHIVADTFSQSHVARILGTEPCNEDTIRLGEHEQHLCAGKIAYLTPWRLRTFIPYLFHPAAWKYHFNESHHGIGEARDEDYLDRSSAECTDLDARDAPLPLECLSLRGRMAAYALADLLTRLSKILGENRCRPINSSLRTCSNLDSELQVFYSIYLRHALESDVGFGKSVQFTPSPNSTQDTLFSSRDVESEPLRDLGLALSFDMTADEPVWLCGQLFGFRNGMESEEFGFLDLSMSTLELRVPLEDSTGRRQLGGAFEWGLKFPMDLEPSGDYGLIASARARLEYTVSPISDGVARHLISPGFGGIAIDMSVLNRLWLGVEGPRCMYRYDTWLQKWNTPACYWGVKAGGVFGAF